MAKIFFMGFKFNMNINSIDLTQKNYNPGFNAEFTALERKLMDEVREYTAKNGVETCRFIKNGKDITSQLKLVEDVCSCYAETPDKNRLLGINLEKLGPLGRGIMSIRRHHFLRGTTFIHSHTSEMTFSPGDINAALIKREARTIVVTPDNHCAVMEIAPKKRIKARWYLHKYEKWWKTFAEMFKDIPKENKPELAKHLQPKMMQYYVQKTGIQYESDIPIPDFLTKSMCGHDNI